MEISVTSQMKKSIIWNINEARSNLSIQIRPNNRMRWLDWDEQLERDSLDYIRSLNDSTPVGCSEPSSGPGSCVSNNTYGYASVVEISSFSTFSGYYKGLLTKNWPGHRSITTSFI